MLIYKLSTYKWEPFTGVQRLTARRICSEEWATSMNWKSIKQPDIEIYLWSSGAQDGGGLIGVTLHPGPFSIHQERCMDRLKVKTRSESWERTGSRHQHQITSKLDEEHYVTLTSERVFPGTKIKSQSLASNHLGSFWLDLNTGGEGRRERDEGSERAEMRVTQPWILKHQMMIEDEEEEIPLSRLKRTSDVVL